MCVKTDNEQDTFDYNKIYRLQLIHSLLFFFKHSFLVPYLFLQPLKGGNFNNFPFPSLIYMKGVSHGKTKIHIQSNKSTKLKPMLDLSHPVKGKSSWGTSKHNVLISKLEESIKRKK